MREIVNTGPVHSPDIIPRMMNMPPRNEPSASQPPDNDHSPDDSQVNESDIARSAIALASSIQSFIDSTARQTIQYDDTSPGPILTPNGPGSPQQHAGAMTTSPDGLSPPIWQFIPPRAYDGIDVISSINRFVDESEHFEMYRDDPAFRNALDAFLGTLLDAEDPAHDADQTGP